MLVPTYNDGAYLGEALASIESQTLNDFEVIIQDDASQDRTREVAGEWVKRDPRFKIETNAKNLKTTANLNRALSRATGKYVAKLDGDDVWRARFLEIMVSEMEQDSDLSAAYCRTILCDEALEPFASYTGDRPFILFGTDPLLRWVKPAHDFYRMSFNDLQLWSSDAQIHTRKSLIDIGGWDETWGCAADTDLNLRVLERGGLICHNPYAGALYRRRTGSLSGTFRQHGWLKWEGILVHLLSLTRYYEGGHRICTPLRKAWWRYWQNWKAIRRTDEYLQFPEPSKSKIASAAGRLKAPPIRITSEGFARQRLWSMKRRLG